MLVKHIDTLAETTGNINKACELLRVTRKQYDAAKAIYAIKPGDKAIY